MTWIKAPEILVFAGPNGSGKSTVTQAWEKVGLYINAGIRAANTPQPILDSRGNRETDNGLIFLLCDFVF